MQVNYTINKYNNAPVGFVRYDGAIVLRDQYNPTIGFVISDLGVESTDYNEQEMMYWLFPGDTIEIVL